MNLKGALPTLNQTQHSLLLAAETLVVTEGVRALTVRRIAQAAGVNSALIRYHFGNVDALLLELARLNAARIDDQRGALLAVLAQKGAPDFDGAVDALVLPLWASAAMSQEYRALVVLDEIYARASDELHAQIWSLFAERVLEVNRVMAACLPGVDETALAWRIRFVTAAALDIPPRTTRAREPGLPTMFGRDDLPERLAKFQSFARQALRDVR